MIEIRIKLYIIAKVKKEVNNKIHLGGKNKN